MSRSIQTNETNGFERTDHDYGPRPDTRQAIGTDGEGYHHVLDRDTGVVMRFDDHGVERVTDLTRPDRDLDEVLCSYWHHVDEGVGWETPRWLPLLEAFDA